MEAPGRKGFLESVILEGMSRTAPLPGSSSQTRGEELANSLTHGLGAALSIAGLVVMVVFAARHGTARDVVGAAIFGSSLILLYVMSTLYHAFRGPRVKLVFKVFDHSAIFLLIAGTYTPFCLSSLGRTRPAWGWTLFGLVWGLAVLGVTFKGIYYGRIAKSALRPPPWTICTPRSLPPWTPPSSGAWAGSPLSSTWPWVGSSSSPSSQAS